MRSHRRRSGLLSYLLGLMLLAVACSKTTPTPAAPQAVSSTTPVTPTFTVTPPEPTGTPVAASPLVPTAPAAPSPTTSSPASPLPSPSPTPEPGPLPRLLVRIPLTSFEEPLQDLILDRDADRLYVTDSGHLHVLNLDSLAVETTLPVGGNLTLDKINRRLYVWKDVTYNDEGHVTVVDADVLAVLETISPGGVVSVDGERNRLYVGRRVSAYWDEDTPGVRLYDGETFELLAQGPQPGVPLYNSQRDELIIVALTAHLADAETLRVIRDLLPDITAQHEECRGCTGTQIATDAQIFSERDLLAVTVHTIATGGGPGTVIGPRFFDATTLDSITDTNETPPVQRGCRGRLILADPVDDRIYRHDLFVRYVVVNNLLVHGPDGTLETWRDGWPPGVTNPNTGQIYSAYSDGLRVLDLATLSPMGDLAADCIHTLDAEAGRLYAWDEGSEQALVVFAERGAWPTPPPTGPIDVLPDDIVTLIQPSPAFATDRTLFLGIGDISFTQALYRSADGGETWERLRGGLPQGHNLALDLAVSPGFADDRTLFVGGHHGYHAGEGVFRSTNGGDTWEPTWKDLTHLRVQDVALSPAYPDDGTLLAAADYKRLHPWDDGRSIFRSTDRGLSWSLAMTVGSGAELPPLGSLLPPDPIQPTLRFRIDDFGRGVARSTDSGETWEPVVVTRQPDFRVQAVMPSPAIDDDRTAYVLSEYDLFRTVDGGESWQRWVDERLSGRDYTNKLTAGAISPPLADGSSRLFLGTAAGEFWSLNPVDLTWEPMRVATQWPTVLAGEWVGTIEPAPDGSLWLGTWGGGVARYANGAIQARHTVTDGLPSQYIDAIAFTAGDAVWAGGDLPPGVASFDGETWTRHPLPKEGEVIGGVQDIAVGPDGTVWVGAQAPGLLRWDGATWESIVDPEGRTGWRIDEIEMAADGTLWCATTAGLTYYKNGTWSGGTSGEILAVDLGPDGTAALVTGSGAVWRYDGQEWTALPRPREALLSSHALHVTADGAVWLGTSAGIFRYDGLLWRQFTAQDGLPDNQVSAIATDARGRIWFGTRSGAAWVDPAELDLRPVSWPSPDPTPTPTACEIDPAQPLAATHADERIAARLGCPVAEATTTQAAFQPFERGAMFWRADLTAIDVLQEDGRWWRYDDTWNKSQPVDDPSLAPPTDLSQPVRGFGKVWREDLGGPQAEIGWATAPEQSFEMLSQPFGGGELFTGADGEVYALYTDGTWEAVSR